jgi:hypothetical protein
MHIPAGTSATGGFLQSLQAQRVANFTLFFNPPKLALGSTHPPYQPKLGSFTAVRESKPEVNHKRPLNTEFKNEWSYTSSPLVSFYGSESCKVNFYFYLPVSA